MKFALLIPLLLSACAAVETSLPLVTENGLSVQVIDHSRHAGLALRTSDIVAGMIPERADFTGAAYLEFGWGDWDYYQADDPGIWLTLKAALWPTASVLHLVGSFGNPASEFPGAYVIVLKLRPDAYGRLLQFVHDSFDRQGKGKAPLLGRGHGSSSGFYPARGRFHIFHTCNGWVAEALEEAGLDLGWPRPITADQLMKRIRGLLRKQRQPQAMDKDGHRENKALAKAVG